MDEGRGRSELLSLGGVGPKLSLRLSAAGYKDLGALARAFPLGHRSVRRVRSVEELMDGEELAAVGELRSVSGHFRGRRHSLRLRVTMDSGDEFEVRYFNQPYLRKRFQKGQILGFAGPVAKEVSGGRPVLLAPRVFEPGEGPPMGLSFEACYSDHVEGLSGERLGRFAREALARIRDRLEERLSPEELSRLGCLPVAEALELLHAPSQDTERMEAARRRAALEEASTVLARVRERRAWRRGQKAAPIAVSPEIKRRIEARMPFRLSEEQARCVCEIESDLARPYPMARLLQGDVGCGKTLVAFHSCLAATAAGFKALILVPTELLAEQYDELFRKWLHRASLPVHRLTSSMSKGEQNAVRAALREDPPCLVVGTHALLSDAVEPRGLGLLVIDEQHRFGVQQRAELFRRMSGLRPHVLVMSATPIPRTLATALLGDLELSEIRHPPVPRPGVDTELFDKEDWPLVVERIRGEHERGGQVFVVCPRIGAAEDENSEAAIAGAVETERLLSRVLPVGLVHGRLDAAERHRVQRSFRSGELRVLVGTTVLEVGLDVPSATMMVIRDAERLGLATLHQLRGRVGRGQAKSSCLILRDPAAERLAILQESQDGFELAEADLRARGAGQLTGLRQAGHGQYSCLDPFRDLDLLRFAARQDASAAGAAADSDRGAEASTL